MAMLPVPTSYRVDDPYQMTVGQLAAPASSYNLDASGGPTPVKPPKPPAPPPPTMDPGALNPPARPTPILPPPSDMTAVPAGGLTNVTQFTPDQNLIGAQITAGPTDRMGLARQYFTQFQEATNPAYEATIRSATQHAAANGRLHSGMLTTDYGNLADSRARDLDLLQRGLLTDATQGSIQDAANARGELRTERDYQNSQSQRAIQNAIQQYLLSLNIGNTQLNAGEAGNPSNILLGAGDQKQQQANDTTNAAANAIYQYYLNQQLGG